MPVRNHGHEKLERTFCNGALVDPGKLVRNTCSWGVFRFSDWGDIIILTINHVLMPTMCQELNTHDPI